MDKHTRPYTCKNLDCTGISFGDRAGLYRHEREKHRAAKYFCQNPICPRHGKGFARKNHLDLHMVARHPSGPPNAEVLPTPESIGHLEIVDENRIKKQNGDMIGEMRGLKAKLEELETRRQQLASCQLKIEEDILAVQRTMQLCNSEGN
jgi:hypothetical protein